MTQGNNSPLERKNSPSTPLLKPNKARQSNDLERAQHVEAQINDGGEEEHEEQCRPIRAGQRKLILVQVIRRRDDHLFLNAILGSDNCGAGRGAGALAALLLLLDDCTALVLRGLCLVAATCGVALIRLGLSRQLRKLLLQPLRLRGSSRALASIDS